MGTVPPLKKPYKILTLLAMILVALGTLTLIIGYQVVQWGNYIFSAVALLIPFRYLLCDIIAEVYGFKIARKLIIYFIFCGISFAAIASNIIKLPPPTYWTHQNAYYFVLGNSLRVMCYASIGVLVGSLLNVYLVSKWKVLTKGKFFWLRSFGSSGIGELLQYSVGLTLMFHNFLDFKKLLTLIVADYLIQILILFVFSPIAHILMLFLRNHEEININENTIKLDPL